MTSLIRATGATAVFDDELLAECTRKPFGEGAADIVGAGRGRIGDDDADGTVRVVVLRAGGRGHEHKSHGNGELPD